MLWCNVVDDLVRESPNVFVRMRTNIKRHGNRPDSTGGEFLGMNPIADHNGLAGFGATFTQES
ncbi:hypothetical protein GGC64_003618 [Mycobacterium sp. OAS707]|nr:hypothetical protein [Mycobacterium sp. OAS707]